ncbi:MAG: hypothetical protein H0W40_13195 [Methylibium sp.]|nr:hypothetical protein [Methylibium sp.]MBA3598311.1 hypothetical protein [Methylibium sp.]
MRLNAAWYINDAPAQNKRIDELLAEHGSAPGSLLVTDVTPPGVRVL